MVTGLAETLFACLNMVEEAEKSALEKIALVLLAHGVEFVVVGGQAELLMGSPRVTYDIDLCYRRSKENLRHLAAALREIKPTLRNAPADLPFIIDEQSLRLQTSNRSQPEKASAYGKCSSSVSGAAVGES